MALPNTFAAVTAATGAQLDANFNADGKLGIIPCAVAGSNDLVLTPAAGIAPTIAAYSNYLQFSGVVTTGNNGPVTIQVGALAKLNGYKDSAAGPVALSGGELIQNNAFTASYNSALNSGAGGFHIYTGTGFAGGTITGNVVLSNVVLSVLGASVGASLTSTLLTGNSLSISAVSASITNIGATSATITSVNATSASVTNLLVGATAATVGHILSGLGTLTFTVTPANQAQDQNMVVTGAQVRDVVSIGLGSSVPAGAGFTGFCGTIGTVTVRMINPTAASIAAATMTVRAMAMGLTP